MRRCPHCQRGELLKVIFGGFPMRLCSNEDCSEISGFWSWTIGRVIPFNGWFFMYEGSYFKALWIWITKPVGEL